MGAFHVEITDYPAPGIMSAIKKNVSVNLNMEEQSRVSITALDWTDENALEAVSQKHPKGFTRLVEFSHTRGVQAIDQSDGLSAGS